MRVVAKLRRDNDLIYFSLLYRGLATECGNMRDYGKIPKMDRSRSLFLGMLFEKSKDERDLVRKDLENRNETKQKEENKKKETNFV